MTVDFLWVFTDEREACRAMVRAYLSKGWRLVTVDFDDPGDVTETPAGSPHAWVGVDGGQSPLNHFVVTGELDADDIHAVLAA